MLTVGDALAKTLAKSQKVTFWSQKNGFIYFFFLANCSYLSKNLVGVHYIRIILALFLYD